MAKVSRRYGAKAPSGSRPPDRAASVSTADAASIPNAIDWLEEGKKHFMQSKLHPERLCGNYPTQDRHSPQAEADFISGFKIAQAEWDRGGGLNGLQSYMAEIEETEDGQRRIILKPAIGGGAQ